MQKRKEVKIDFFFLVHFFFRCCTVPFGRFMEKNAASQRFLSHDRGARKGLHGKRVHFSLLEPFEGFATAH